MTFRQILGIAGLTGLLSAQPQDSNQSFSKNITPHIQPLVSYSIPSEQVLSVTRKENGSQVVSYASLFEIIDRNGNGVFEEGDYASFIIGIKLPAIDPETKTLTKKFFTLPGLEESLKQNKNSGAIEQESHISGLINWEEGTTVSPAIAQYINTVYRNFLEVADYFQHKKE